MHIGFCGIDGAGKSTQVRLLYSNLLASVPDLVVHEGTRNFVSEISYVIAHRRGLSSGKALLGEDRYILAMSFEVLRQKLHQISPMVENGVTVLSSRTVFDWFAGTKARGCSDTTYALIRDVLLFGGLPDLTFWVDTTPEIAVDRVAARGFDTANLRFQQSLRDEYRRICDEFGVMRINGDPSIPEVTHSILREVAAAGPSGRSSPSWNA